jgi:ABC-type multidrug transport system fused ATPase/permease subunit
MKSIIKYIKEIYILTGRDKESILKIIVMGFLLGVADIIALIFLGTFIANIGKNAIIFSGKFIGIDIVLSPLDIGLLTLGIYSTRLIFGAFVIFKTNIYSSIIESNLKSQLLYKFHNHSLTSRLEKETGELSNALNLWTAIFSRSLLTPLGKSIADSMVAIILIAYFSIIYPKIILGFVSFGVLAIFAYDKIFLTISKKNSETYKNNSLEVSSAIENSLSAYREILSLNISKYFSDQVRERSMNVGKAYAVSNTISSSPRLLIEALIIFSMVIYIFYSTYLNKGLVLENIPQVTTLFFIIMRLSSLASILTATITNLRLYRNIVSYLFVNYLEKDSVSNSKKNSSTDFFEFKYLQVKNLNFNYKNSSDLLLKNINFKLNKSDKVLIFGQSGCGKSTLIDLLLGLIQPKSGGIYISAVDGKKMNSIINCASYFSQDPFILNTTVKSNVAIGLNVEEIDNNKLLSSLKNAGLTEFLMKNTNEANIGDKGQKLSAGQRQRIALARAFYFNKEILIFDEATNAIDVKTEKNILKKLLSLKDKTVIFISHREEVKKLFTKKYILANGKLIKS